MKGPKLRLITTPTLTRLLAQAGARMSEDLKEALRLAARANDESMSAVIRRALENETRSLIRKLDRKPRVSSSTKRKYHA